MLRRYGLNQELDCFKQALAPIALVGLRQLETKCGPTYQNIFTRAIRRSLAEHLLGHLVKLAGPTLEARKRAAALTDKMFPSASEAVGAGSTSTLNPWDIVAILQIFPGLGETLAIVVADWVTAQFRMLLCLRRDWVHIRRLVGSSPNMTLRKIVCGLSDPHHCGKTVAILHFSGGKRVVYKPRSTAPEAKWYALLHYLNNSDLGAGFRTPGLLPRPNYSWMEFVPSRPCRSLREVRRFYFRWGAQAAVAEVIGSADLHRDNWVAWGSQPVLVDAELLVYLQLKRRASPDRISLDPLLRTGLVRLSRNDRAGYYVGIAPFDSSTPDQLIPACWPRLNRDIQLPKTFASEIRSGFATTSRFLQRPTQVQYIQRIRRGCTPLDSFRILIRPTGDYYRFLRMSLEPRLMLRSGERLAYLQGLLVPEGGCYKLRYQEAAALFRCSIPHFDRTNVGATELPRNPSSGGSAKKRLRIQ